ncbi:hypothetical protein [Streptomyces sp. LS1784]|nr:hypothetical protein [Streptomyces sp. LS1784]
MDHRPLGQATAGRQGDPAFTSSDTPPGTLGVQHQLACNFLAA